MAYTFRHGDRPLDDFTVQRAVGSGGFGEVYYAVSDGGREVALKYLKSNPDVELRGVGHCINLKSPHLVSIFDVKKNADDEYFIVMEYCSGPSLRDLLIAEPDGFGPQKAAFFVREIAKGLAYLHERGIVHRDLKPGNIFYDDGYVKIGDYGLSKFIAVSRHSAQTASVGTVHYMAPEIGSGNYSRGVDIYALGVMLYEMLLGKVPFEGSSMAEVLMKHLTAQPELDELPQPFGNVIRRALAKEPKDRYQSIEEMVSDLLEVESVKESLAGFTPQSLDGAVHRGGADRVRSPMPSPNPPPRRYGPMDAGAPCFQGLPHGLDKRLSKRLDRISRKIDRKIAKLGGRPGPPPPPPSSADRDEGGGRWQPVPVRREVRPAAAGKRMLLTFILAVGLAIGLGLIVGATSNDEERGAAAGMMVVAMSGGVLLARRASAWFGVLDGPKWANRLVRLGCAAPFTAIAAAPMLSGSRIQNMHGLALWGGMLLMVLFAKWERALQPSDDGDLRIGAAIWAGFGGLIATAMVAAVFQVRHPEEIMFVAAGIGAAVALVLQSVVWWRLETIGQPRRAAREAATSGGGMDAGHMDELRQERPIRDSDSGLPPYAQPVSAAPVYATSEADPQARYLRWGVTRAFFGVLSFALMGGAIVTLLLPLILTNLSHDEKSAALVACIACAACWLFTIRKTTPLKKESFWRETFRPFLITVALFGVGASVTAFVRYNHCLQHNDERIALIAAMVFSSLLFLVCLVIRGKRSHRPRPFLRGEGAATPDAHESADAGAGMESIVSDVGERVPASRSDEGTA